MIVSDQLALRIEDAAAALGGISEDHFREHVHPHVRSLKLGRVRLYPVTALQEFLDSHASSPVDDLAERRRRAA